jgi:hypothetical protein
VRGVVRISHRLADPTQRAESGAVEPAQRMRRIPRLATERGLTMAWAALKTYLDELQSRNRRRMIRMLPHIAQLALLGSLLLGLYQVLRLEPSRKRLPKAS